MTDEPTPRGKDIYVAVTGLMHLTGRTDEEDMARGIGPDEHMRRHHVWASGFVTALDYMLEYPEQAAKLINEYRQLMPDETSKARADRVLGFVTEYLYPSEPPVDTANKLIDLAKRYREGHEQTADHVRPVIDNGDFSWQNVPEGKLPFDTWGEAYQEWPGD